MADVPHTPVMAREVLAAIEARDNDIIVDGTFGAGGYTRAILDAANCSVFAIDRDPNAIAAGQALVAEYAPRLGLLEGCFGDMQSLLASADVQQVDGIALDLGVSSMQLDNPERGFSFQGDGPLDMRMQGPGVGSGQSAADVVNNFAEEDIANILWRYGEERRSRHIAHAIGVARREAAISRTGQLAQIVMSVLGRPRHGKVHPATRTFQALRIYVNDELGELERVLVAAERVLRPGGRLAVVSFHSLEDRIVKNFLRERGGLAPSQSRHLPEAPARRAPSFQVRKRSAIKPTQAETKANPRARSARLRAAVRTDQPVWQEGENA
ncbi:MAG: 16S rRNA (cytosine(1402)-N(4))-methyltransferase RsmH [Alphaproteobacteria bacterium]|nr:MAG: 16S rRNA (cytosine(1402)-N(4))-methyltransferase RsmH [Alphaproteobacteria bacterium]